MSLRVTTAIIEPNLLMREGLASLLERYSYRVVGSVNGADDFATHLPPEPPKLVLIGAVTLEEALADAGKSRKLWPDIKVVVLLGPSDSSALEQLLASEIDGCVPLSVSQETLIRTMELVMLENTKVLVMIGPSHTRAQSTMDESASAEPQKNRRSGGDGGSGGNGGVTVVHVASPSLAYVNGDVGDPDTSLPVPHRRNTPRLSERESQVLDSIVCGYSNKLIARKCGITEATVKVHMKSILRKIQVANRTQAAVWAMENNYAVHVEKCLLEVSADGAAA